MTPDQLPAFATVSDPQLHPDGIRVAFVVSRMDFDDDRYNRSIWIWDGDAATRFTHGPIDSRPRWSPEGDTLAFLRSTGEPGTTSQVAVIGTNGGEAAVVTSFELGASEAEWSPDSSRLAVVATEWTEAWSGLEDEERARRPRRVTAPEWRYDHLGYLHNKATKILLVDPDTGESVALTDGESRDSGVTWRPDCSAVAFLSARHDRAGFRNENQVWEIPVAGGQAEAIVPVGDWADISYRPDGVAHATGVANVSEYPTVSGLYRLEGGAATKLTTDLDRTIVSPGSGGLAWLDNGSCLVLVEDRGTVIVVEIADDGSWRELLGGRRTITAISARADGGGLALTSTRTTDPGELAWFDGDTETTLTQVNAGFRSEAELVEPEHILVESDGVDLDVWIYLPAGSTHVPVLFNIHGGPATQYGWGFHDEFQVYAGAGYGVVATNPRGASGRGHDFMRGALGRWNEENPPDLTDLMTALDGAVSHFDRLDGERLGIMGGSYGGLITAKILAIDGRFRSAVPERGLYNFVSFAGTSDIGLWFGGMYVGDRDYGDWSSLWEASPLRTAHRIRTPCLVIHSSSDYRCPVEQGEQLFATLIDNGVDAELLIFPDEGHELSRSGSPQHRRERFDAILEWHNRYLTSNS